MTLFHCDLGFPRLRLPERVKLRYTAHAIQESQQDRFGPFTDWLPQSVDFRLVQIIEVETCPKGTVTKTLIRYTVPDTGKDLCLVLKPSDRPDLWVVITTYLNRSDDHHRTLHKGRYSKPQ
jgi:hypothetical protein